jgi:predicted cobalt transporter CbtA
MCTNSCMTGATCLDSSATEVAAVVRTYLVRGMLVGVLAGLLAFALSKTFGEPLVDRAIAFETQMNEAQAKAHAAMGMPIEPAEPELVGRSMQAGLGLLTGVMVYCAAFGGLFGLVFSVANGRVGRLDARGVSALLAAMGFIAVYLVPSLKYPANPPSVGQPDTIEYRTALYFIMLLISVAAAIGGALLRERLAGKHGGWTAALVALGGYLVVVAVAQFVLPGINEVPEHFPADLLWRFRITSMGTQAVMWATIGLGFGWLTARAAMARSGAARDTRFAPTPR